MGWFSRQIILGFVLMGACVSSTLGDDLKLKDGSKINGTIVGFDDSSFKVQTAYGFALVRRDQVVSITMTAAPNPAAEKTARDALAEEKAKKPTEQGTHTTPASSAQAKLDPVSDQTAKSLAASDVGPSVANASPRPAVAAPAAAPAPSTAASAPPPPAVTTPPTPAPPLPIRENVNGNLYTNESYGFQMYKPPSWQVIAGAQSLLPGAIAAMGTLDQTTYLLIGREPAGKSLTSDIGAIDDRLRSLMGNFRPQAESRVNVSGTTAVEQHFRGSIDQKDWSGTVVFVRRGDDLFTIFGMTIADTDLVQIQENVIERAVSSIKFAQ